MAFAIFALWLNWVSDTPVSSTSAPAMALS